MRDYTVSFDANREPAGVPAKKNTKNPENMDVSEVSG